MLDYQQAAEQLREVADLLDGAVDCLDDNEALRQKVIKLRNAATQLCQECEALVPEEDVEVELERDEEEAGD